MSLVRKGTEDKMFSIGEGDKSTRSSFPFLANMQEFWQLWGPQIVEEYGRCGWVLLLMDANEKLEGLMMTLARILRNKPQWNTTGWSEQEWTNVEDRADEAYAWFCRNLPDMRDIPEFAKFLFVGQDGLFCALKKLSAEVREIQEEGHLLVNLTNPDTGTVESTKHVYLES